MSSIRAALVLFICLNVALLAPQVQPGTANKKTVFDHGVDLPTKRPLIVAHRGSCGTLPEHTVRAYQLAVDQGADIIECDLTITKDRVLICMHECWMNATTNVAEVYPQTRMNTYYVQDEGQNITDYFTVDFTLSELNRVRRVQQLDFRDPNYNGQFGIATLEEYIAVAKGAERPVGIYVETKDPIFINSLPVMRTANVTLEDMLLEMLRRYDYTKKSSPCFLESFDENSLLYMANKTFLPLIVLLSDTGTVSNATLARYATFAYGIGPDKRQLVSVNAKNQIDGRSDLVQRAHAFGLRVHPYTLRNENQYLAWDYGQDPANEYTDLFGLEIDGAFTDFPATYYNFLNYTYMPINTPTQTPTASGTASFLANALPVFISFLLPVLLSG